MKIIVNDANILIDLVELRLLHYFFRLKFEFHTTELVLAELFDDQYSALEPYIVTGYLIVDEITTDDLSMIIQIQNTKPALSEQDCSALYQAQKSDAILITSDNTLRRYATSNNVEVHGHLWIFDHLVRENIFCGSKAVEKLTELRTTVNPKLGLPEIECQKRISYWLHL